VDQIIGGLARLRKQTANADEDVRNLREHYTAMSLEYAEVSAEK
jgi:hypothetical protein